MSIAYIAEFINETYDLVSYIGAVQEKGFENWLDELDNDENVMDNSLDIISGTLLSICLLYSLARWQLIIQKINDKNYAVSAALNKIINILTAVLIIFGLLL